MNRQGEPQSFSSLNIDDFVRRLGSDEPAPGGGAAAALIVQLAAALVQMVCRHTLGHPKYAAVEPQVRDMLAQAEQLAGRAGQLIDQDATSYARAAVAFKLPKADPQRTAAVGEACQSATEIPLEVMRTAAAVAELAVEIRHLGNQTLASDARAALLAAQTGAEISAGNVASNRPFIVDVAWAEAAAAEAAELQARIAHLCSQPG